MRKWIKRMLPVAGIIIVTIILSLALYHSVIAREEEKCWQILKESAESVNKEIAMKIEDEVDMLRVLKELMQEEQATDEQVLAMPFESFQSVTFFSRIEVVYPNRIVVAEGGEQKVVMEEVDFDELSSKGERMTSRNTDPRTGKECVYYCLPVVRNEKTKAVIVGVIESDTLAKLFRPTIYGGQANCCLVDSSDGEFLMDTWHEELGNVFDMENRERLEGYKDIDLKTEMANQRTGVVAFMSNTVGKPLYMYYMPSDVFDWQLEVFVLEDVAFEGLIQTRKIVAITAIVEAILLLMYFGWNLVTVGQLERSNTEIEKQKEQLSFMSYRDALTGVYNRNKYIHELDSVKDQLLKDVGVIYIDLNGLKEINDSQSHVAGDLFICNAAHAISDVFENETYRIGGDEFVVLTRNVEKEAFSKKMESLHEKMQEGHINVSIGSLWQSQCDNLEAMLHVAEEEMYREKQMYYAREHKRR